MSRRRRDYSTLPLFSEHTKRTVAHFPTKGTWEIEVWYEPLSDWSTYYGAYCFTKKRLASVLKFAKNHCFFCGDLNDHLHGEMRLRNVRSGMTMPFSVLFAGDPAYHECQRDRRANH